MKWIVTALALVLASAWALAPQPTHGQEGRDPLIDPAFGGEGSRFQVVGQTGWTPGERVRVRIGFAPSAPFDFDGPFPFQEQVTVLADGTWSFPVVVNDDLLGAPLPDTPGFIVVVADSPSRIASNAYVFTVNGTGPPGAEQIADLGFGAPAPPPGVALTLALFGAATGALLLCAGRMRRITV